MTADGDSAEAAIPDDQMFLTLSMAAVTGAVSSTMSMAGLIQGHQVHILIDFGSSHTFISQQLVDLLQGKDQLQVPLRVQVANGYVLQCFQYFPAAKWSIQGHEFQADLKVFPLSFYDMILGLDWLEQFSPMRVHWKQKWMTIPYNNSSITLFGSLPELPEGSILQVCVVDVYVGESVEANIPSDIQDLIEEFAELFVVPKELPPSRHCDHSIPLVPGASPFRIRPYRFAPQLKIEIEEQVKEMLASGLIQKSSSPFSSSVLLVKKKDNSWRFCVDYRHLNAITIKGKFPVPIIDEFLDELFGASWFICLDLRSGFHQIFA
jgi:hypothetical protein